MARRSTRHLRRLSRWLAVGLLLLVAGVVAAVYLRWHYREQRWNALIEQIAPIYGVDKFLVKAVMRQESGFDPFALSPKGAIGLMQVMPATGGDWARAAGYRGFSRESLWQPRINIHAGTWYLARALSYWQTQGVDDPVPFALAEYNAGRANALRWRAPTAAQFVANITNPAVRHYIQRVQEFHQHYRARGTL